MVSPNDQKVLFFDPRLCTGCRSCEAACTFNKYKVCDYNLSLIRHSFSATRKSFETVYCFHCENPLCLDACPSEAINKDESTGIVKIDSLKCIGCQLCNYICPLAVPQFDNKKRVSVKCDLCDGDPECVKYCSPQALRFIPRDRSGELLKSIYFNAHARSRSG